MNLNKIQTKNQTEHFLLSKTKTVKRLLNKHIPRFKKRLNLEWSNQEKIFISIHQFKLRMIGCWD